MILCVVSESLGTDVLSNYVDEQKDIERNHGNSISNNDIVGAFSFNIFVGVYVATIFGAAFFFDLFWPERHESKSVRIAWKACSVLASCFALASAIVLTVIVSTHRAKLTGPGNVKLSPPLAYKKNGEAIASVVLIWLGWVATVWSTVLMFQSVDHIEAHGPFSVHARSANAVAAKNNTIQSPHDDLEMAPDRQTFSRRTEGQPSLRESPYTHKVESDSLDKPDRSSIGDEV